MSSSSSERLSKRHQRAPKSVFSISNTTRTRVPRLPFERLARSLLGSHYELSLAFVGDIKSRQLNKVYRKKSYTPNVLSFPLNKQSGEIIINPKVAAREARRFNVPYRNRIALLFIHGCLHLKGLPHGATMDSITQRTLRKLSLS